MQFLEHGQCLFSNKAIPSVGPNTTAPAIPVNSSIRQKIFNDASLAAVYEGSGDRHIFFQDLEENIQ